MFENDGELVTDNDGNFIFISSSDVYDVNGVNEVDVYSNSDTEDKIEDSTKGMPLWSPMWFRYLAKLFMDTDDIKLDGKLGKDYEFTIIVKNIQEKRVKVFKQYINNHIFLFGMPIKIINLKAENENKEKYIEVKLVEVETMTRKGYLCKYKGYTNTDLHSEDDANGYVLKNIKGHVIGWECNDVFNKQYLKLPADVGISISEKWLMILLKM